GEAAAPAPLLAARLSASARAALRFAVALDGEVPHQAHLPALVGDTHADAALGELAACGLVSPVGGRYRLAAGVQAQLETAGYADDAATRARTAAQHYAWWAGHPSVTPERVCAEADAVLAALAVTVPETERPTAEGEQATSVELARTAAPAFAAGLRWSAWEQALHEGAEAARLAGESADRAYFHHELGVLALCTGQLDRARSELEASIGLRGSLADKRGTTAGRRALALVADRSGDVPGLAFTTTAAEETPEARHEEPLSPPRGIMAALPSAPPTGPTLVTGRPAATPPAHRGRGGLRGLARRNLVAAGAGALLVAVLGTVVTLGATSGADPNAPSDTVGVNPTLDTGAGDDAGGETPGDDTGAGDTGDATSSPSDPGPEVTSGAPSPTPTESAEPSPDASSSHGTGNGSTSPTPTGSPSTSHTSGPSTTPSDSGSASPSDSASPSGSASASDPADPPSQDTSSSASDSISSAPESAASPSGSGSSDADSLM
ncbi:ATP-binding protein, partial [Streptomyces sp. ID05-39B]|nr:ATP-binding protein [Streptomyces sp. ID05-39B]